MPDAPTIPGLRLLQPLGEGGMGRVYLAEDETLGRRTAVKVISERIAGDSDARKRFLREARAMATVEHPHVVRIYSFGEVAGAAYLVMEYVEGEVLSARLKREGRLDTREALRIARQVVEALEAAWEKRLVHRDVKPSNILLDAKGQVRVADFGLAKPIQDSDPSLTASGSILGTPHYVSPEQARGKPVDFRSDVYSLGIVLYEMLAGVRPFEGTTPFDVVAKHIHEALPPLAARRPDVPAGVAQLLEWMTAKDPSARPESYASLRTRIDGEMAGASTAQAVVPATRNAGDATSADRASLPRAALGALAVACVTAVVWLAWSRPAPAPTQPQGLAVAVTPFYGPDDDSAKEGRVMAALVERAILQRLPPGDVKVFGVEETKQPVRDQAAARALGERLGASLVVWGEAFVLRGETEIQPSFTLVPRKAAGADAVTQRSILDARSPLEELSGRGTGAVTVGAQAPNQIELRKTGAAGVGDLVLLLAGVHALYTEDKPEKALKLFEQAPLRAETLRHRSVALLRLKRPDDARRALEEAVRLEPKDAQSWGSLGDLHMEADRFADAVAAYRRAAELGSGYTTRQAVLFEGKLYAREKVRLFRDSKWESWDSGYLLALDPESSVVRERHRLGGDLLSLRIEAGQLVVTCQLGGGDMPMEETVRLSGSHLDHRLSLPVSLFLRKRGEMVGRLLAANFVDPPQPEFKPTGSRDDVPKTFPELEAALGRARQADPNQPWHLFFLGQAQWWQGRKAEAAATWTELFAGEYAATPYYEYSWMAAHFETFGQGAWADRAFEEALRRRRALPQPITTMSLIERLLGAPFVRAAAERLAASSRTDADLERGHLWLTRARELGPVGEMDDFAAAAWASYFRKRGDAARAETEQSYSERVRQAPANFTQPSARWDYVFQTHLAATLALWTACLALLRAAARREPEAAGGSSWRLHKAMPRLTRRERGVLLTACGLVASSYVCTALVARRIEAFTEWPIGAGDAVGNPAIIRDLERRLLDHPDSSIRFAAAVANHLGGRAERADELYKELAGDARAQKNLEALRAGSLTPPEFSDNDLAAAYTALPWRRWVSSIWDLPGILKAFGGFFASKFAVSLATVERVIDLWNLLLGLPLVAGLLLAPLRSGGPSATQAPVFEGRLRAVPGFLDLQTGSPWRGWTALASGLLVVTAIGVHVVANWGKELPVTGPLTALVQPGMERTFPLPPDISRWTLYWTYRDAPYFWGLVAVAAATSLGLHLTRKRVRAAASQTALPPTQGADESTPDDVTRSRM